MNWSQYQLDFFDEIVRTNNSIVLKATAGSGKTTSAVHAAKLIRDNFPSARSCFLAFNKSIQTELQERLPENFFSRTLNSFFYEYLRKGTGIRWFKVDARKYTHIALGFTSTVYEENRKAYAAAARMANIIHFLRVTETDVYDKNAVWDMLDKYGIQTNGVHPTEMPDIFDAIQRLGKQFALNHRGISFWQRGLENPTRDIVTRILTGMGVKSQRKQAWIDWDEQVYLPISMSLVKGQFDFLIVDEAQDLSKLHQTGLKMAMKDKGRIIAIGDQSQSIYGFNGADSNGMDRLLHDLNATPLPLSISYRCPKTHVLEAQEIDPTIEASDNAIMGNVDEVDFPFFIQFAKELTREKVDTLGMGRKNVTIVRAALSLLSNRIPVTIKGRKFGETLSNIIKKIAYTDGGNLRKGFSFDEFDVWLSKWHGKEMEALEKRNARESAKIMLNDKQECLNLLWYSFFDEYEMGTVDNFMEFIEDFFSQENGQIVLSTVHRAKGLEANTTIIFNPDEMPLEFRNQSDEEKQQELNIKFVALTRSKENMIFVTLPSEEN